MIYFSSGCALIWQYNATILATKTNYITIVEAYNKCAFLRVSLLMFVKPQEWNIPHTDNNIVILKNTIPIIVTHKATFLVYSNYYNYSSFTCDG